MKYAEAREQLIRTWGQLSSAWGINRAMGQIHALLMIAPDPLSADHIIQELTLSRGSVSMSLRSLIEWGLVHKVYMPGDRKEYFEAEKDIWRVALRITLERKQRELDPIIHTLQSIQ